MTATRTYRLGDGPATARLYLDGRRSTHLGRRIDALASRLHTRRSDGAVFVREFHYVRIPAEE